MEKTWKRIGQWHSVNDRLVSEISHRSGSILTMERETRPHSDFKQYRAGTFHKRVAYGQRDRKLMLVARGILKGFKVTCKSDKEAANLAYSLRIRAARTESQDYARFGLRVKVDGRRVYVIGTPKRSSGQVRAT